MALKFLSVILCIFGISQIVWADTKLTATVDKTTLTQDDILVYSLTITGDSDIDDLHPKLPDLKDFEVMRSNMMSSSQSRYINGKFTFQKQNTYQYELSPQKTGVLKIGKASLDAKNGVIQSGEISVTVKPEGSGVAKQLPKQKSAPQADPFDNEDEDDLFSQLLRNRGFMLGPGGGAKSAPKPDKNAFFVSVEVNKKKVYVGEQIVATWYLYTQGNLQDFDALKYPELKGFWKEDLEIAQRLNFEEEIVNGTPYRRALLVSYALFPLTAGRKTIDAFKAKATIISGGAGSLGVFGFGRPYSFTKTSQELPVEVVALPTEGRPANFSGAVGKFNISGSLGASSVKVNQPFSLKIRFQGQGNVKAIELPSLNLPSNIELYDTKKESQFSKSGDGFIEFEVLLIPRSAGEAVISPLALSFFDPSTGKYVVKNTPEFKIKVLPGDGTSQDGSGAMSPMPAANTSPVVKGLRFLKNTKSYLALSSQMMWAIWFLMFLLPIIYLVLSASYAHKKKTAAAKSNARSRAKEKLKKARQLFNQGDKRSAGIEIVNAVMGALAQVAKVGGVAMTAQELTGMISQLPQEKKDEILSFLARCELVSFAPEGASQNSNAQDNNLLPEAEKVIAGLLDLL